MLKKTPCHLRYVLLNESRKAKTLQALSVPQMQGQHRQFCHVRAGVCEDWPSKWMYFCIPGTRWLAQFSRREGVAGFCPSVVFVRFSRTLGGVALPMLLTKIRYTSS